MVHSIISVKLLLCVKLFCGEGAREGSLQGTMAVGIWYQVSFVLVGSSHCIMREYHLLLLDVNLALMIDRG